MEVDVMRELQSSELVLVSGATGQCTPENSGSGNTYGGVSDPSSVAQDLIEIYEGAIEVTSYIIERVAKSL
jgi:hypothetical protein